MKRQSGTVVRSHQVDAPALRHRPLVDLLVDTRTELLEVAIRSGLKVFATMLEEDRIAIRRDEVTVDSRGNVTPGTTLP